MRYSFAALFYQVPGSLVAGAIVVDDNAGALASFIYAIKEITGMFFLIKGSK